MYFRQEEEVIKMSEEVTAEREALIELVRKELASHKYSYEILYLFVGKGKW